MALGQRLMRDIAELQIHPYPNITLFPHQDITKACLVLNPNGKDSSLHLTVCFGSDYPLSAPSITMQSRIVHPNVFGSYICASILNTDEGYTPAYTLKAIAIPLLSFFSSDKLEQGHGGEIDLVAYRARNGHRTHIRGELYEHQCSECGFGLTITPSQELASPPSKPMSISFSAIQPEVATEANTVTEHNTSRLDVENAATDVVSSEHSHNIPFRSRMMQPALPSMLLPSLKSMKKVLGDEQTPKMPRSFANLPDEIILLVCKALETEELMVFARAWERIGGESGIMTKYDLIRTRELQCFCLKEDFTKAKLGVGVSVFLHGRQGTLESEFDLLGLQAFKEFEVRRSVQGIPFRYWLPLPISRRHFNSVKAKSKEALLGLGRAARLPSSSPVDVVYHFMNDVVVKLSRQASESLEPGVFLYASNAPTSTLKHASEKAIESYFHLFHLLLCLATENGSIVRSANSTIQAFLSGRTSKDVCPNLGHLLVAILVSDFDMTQELTLAIINETIIRNVVWMLDTKGSGFAELSYMEASTVSQYRLQKTFEAGKTSYRLLMFLNLFLRTVNQGIGHSRKSLQTLLDDLFDAHGAPPKGAANKLANDVKRLQGVNTFPDFLATMGVQKMPTAASFTTFLRTSLELSVAKGYSVWGMTQGKALALRQVKEPGVEKRPDAKPEWQYQGNGSGSFFPSRGRSR